MSALRASSLRLVRPVVPLEEPENALDPVDDRLVERRVRAPCLTLGVHVLIASLGEYAVGARLAYDSARRRLVPTPAGAELAAKEAERAAREAERAAHVRIAELERELKKKKRKK